MGSAARGALWLGLAAALAAPAAGQPEGESPSFQLREVERLHLDDVHPGAGGERVVDLYFRALTRHGEPVEHLRPVDVELREDDRRIPPEAVTLQPLAETERGLTCVLALDVSRTMKGKPFERARRGALDFLERLGSRDRVAVVAFADDVEVVAPFGASRGEAKVQLESLRIDEGSLSTALFDGVHRALELVREGAELPRRSFAVVFSDGKDAGSRTDLETVLELASGGAAQPRVLVFGIGYARFGGEGLEVMRRLSKQTGAEFLQASSATELDSFYDEVRRQMMRSYVARFETALDGTAHRLQIAAEGRSDTRTATYPDDPRPWWPWLAGGGLVVGLGVGAWALLARRSPGRLVFVNGPRAGEAVPLPRGRLRIGALGENDLVLPAETVSRYHAEIHAEGGRVEIQDLRSRNGTEVNGRAVQASPLHPGDRVRIADQELVYER